jgi:hypothetical protein
MRKIMGIAMAALLALPLVASAEEVAGKVKSINREGGFFTLEDGTQLWAPTDLLMNVQEGQNVLTSYESKDGKKMAVTLERRTRGPVDLGGQETTNFAGPLTSDQSIQSPGQD